MRKILIRIQSDALGDTIAWFPYVEEYRIKHDLDELYVYSKCHKHQQYALISSPPLRTSFKWVHFQSKSRLLLVIVRWAVARSRRSQVKGGGPPIVPRASFGRKKKAADAEKAQGI